MSPGHCNVYQERGRPDELSGVRRVSFDPVADLNLQFDSRKGATWHCIVGRNFGSFVTHGNGSLGLLEEGIGY